ncbi:MAG: TadE/TadG family type IV pilus assembly protein [Geminicoccaceae bacterium]
MSNAPTAPNADERQRVNGQAVKAASKHCAPQGREVLRRGLIRSQRAGDIANQCRFRRHDRGNVVVEFALVLPVLLMMMLASAELGRFVLLNQKIDRVAITMSDLVARAETISESELDDIFNAAAHVAEPFDLGGSGRVVISSVTNVGGGGATVAWQRTGGGSFITASEIGAEGETADLPDDFAVRDGETAIISEVFFDFEPFLSEVIVSPRVIYRRAHHRPRLGTLDTVESN